MSGPWRARRADIADIDQIMSIYDGRQAWLREIKFSDQWASVDEWRYLLKYLVRRGNVWVLTVGDRGPILGTVTLSADPDRDFWNECERSVPALYVSKLATDVHAKGQELGRALLDRAERYALARGVEVLRLDTWKTSTELRDYYEKRGWKHVRTVKLDERQSGSLFERRLDAQRLMLEHSGPPTGAFALPRR